MKKLIISACILLTTAITIQAQETINKVVNTLEKTIDSYILSFPKHEEFSGVILIADGDSIRFHKGYGMANREFGIANGEKTRFQIGSITKAFTSMLFLKLVEKGIIDLDKSICDYLPFYPQEPGRLITIRNLLSHTSGIPHHFEYQPEYWTKDDHYFHTPGELISLFWDAPLKNKPGERFTYSSPGYYILGVIAQQVTKKSYAELLQEYFFLPLGMKDSHVDNNSTTDTNLATGYIRGISGLVKAYIEDKSTALAAGDIISTAYDLFLWQRILNPKGDQILTEASKKLMFQPVLPDKSMTLAGPLFRIPYNDGKKSLAVNILSGSSSGYSSCISRMTEDDRCVIVLGNINLDDVSRIADDIADIYLRRYVGISAGAESPLTRIPPQANTVNPLDYAKASGFYYNGNGIYMGVIQNNSQLFYLTFNKLSGVQVVWELIPTSSDSFYLGYNTSFRGSISKDINGMVSQLSASRNGRIFNEAKRCAAIKQIDSEYTGYYTSLELQQTFHFFIQQDNLFAENFLGEAQARFIMLEKDLFGFSYGFIRFFRGQDNSLTGFEVFTKDTDKLFGSRFIKIVY